MEKLDVIKKTLQAADVSMLPELILAYEEDARQSVQKELEKARNRIKKHNEEVKRTYQMFAYEREYHDYQYICGIDEVGRGPFAGPVVACAVILPKNCNILYLNDSKQVAEKKREELYDQIMKEAIAVGIGYNTPERIDEINILQATYEAMRDAIGQLAIKPDLLLNDAVTIPEISIPQVPIIKGDAKSGSIAAASIVAKVTRDRLMCEYAKIYPEYMFEKNKGYGSKEHRDALKLYGPTPIHRKSFIKNYI